MLLRLILLPCPLTMSNFLPPPPPPPAVAVAAATANNRSKRIKEHQGTPLPSISLCTSDFLKYV